MIIHIAPCRLDNILGGVKVWLFCGVRSCAVVSVMDSTDRSGVQILSRADIWF